MLCRRKLQQPILSWKAGQTGSDSGAPPTPKQSEKKNHTTTQILPMEEGQDVEACSANEKNDCKLAA